jgi:hypothetical protein
LDTRHVSHFPDPAALSCRRPPTPRWNWVIYLALGMWLFFMAITPFLDAIQATNGDWTLVNPLGFILLEFFEGPFLIAWGIGLITVVGAGAVSLFVRYRRTGGVGRRQIKWVLYAGALFAGYYNSRFYLQLDSTTEVDVLWNLLFTLSILTFPIAIAIASASCQSRIKKDGNDEPTTFPHHRLKPPWPDDDRRSVVPLPVGAPAIHGSFVQRRHLPARYAKHAEESASLAAHQYLPLHLILKPLPTL